MNPQLEYEMPTLLVKRLKFDALIPRRATTESIGYDVYAYLRDENGREGKRTVQPKMCYPIPTGLCVNASRGYGVFVYCRSGLASKGIIIANSPGVIDPDYRGELKILLANIGYEGYVVRHNERIAQLIIHPLVDSGTVEVFDFPPTERGEGGFGSTGR